MKAQTASSFIRELFVVLGPLFILTPGMMVISPYMLGGEEMETWMLIVNALLPAVPIGLLYTLIGILIVAIYRHRQQEPISLRLANWIYWSPRICCIALVAFMSLFAFDVFEEGYTLGEMLVGFLMHMIPMLALAIVLVIAWRWPWVGAAAFGLAALAFSFRIFAGGLPGLGTFLIIGAPLLMIALLFALNARWKREIVSACEDPVVFWAGIINDLAYGFILAALFLLISPGLPGAVGHAKGVEFALILWFLRVVISAASHWMMFNVPLKTLPYTCCSCHNKMKLQGYFKFYCLALRQTALHS